MGFYFIFYFNEIEKFYCQNQPARKDTKGKGSKTELPHKVHLQMCGSSPSKKKKKKKKKPNKQTNKERAI